MATKTPKTEPLKKKKARPRRTRKARLTTEIPPEQLDALRDLSAYLQGKGYDAPMAKLVERFIKEGIENLKKEVGIKRIPKAGPLKTLPGDEPTGRTRPEGNRVATTK